MSVYITESAATDKHTGCFTGQSKVVLEDGRQKNMSQVTVGDRIQSVDAQGNIVYSEVLMFLDREPEEKTRFVNLKTEDGASLALTASHLVYAGAPDCWDLQCMSPVYAGNVEKGQNLMVREKSLVASPVLSVTSSHQTGVFAPLTRAGTWGWTGCWPPVTPLLTVRALLTQPSLPCGGTTAWRPRWVGPVSRGQC